MKQPYIPPADSDEESIEEELISKRRKLWRRTIWFSLAGFLLPPIIGLAGTFAYMFNAFGELSRTGTADPAAMANEISLSLLGTAAGLMTALISLVILIVALIRYFTLPKPNVKQ